MKKILISLAAIMVFGLTACSDSDSPEDTESGFLNAPASGNETANV